MGRSLPGAKRSTGLLIWLTALAACSHAPRHDGPPPGGPRPELPGDAVPQTESRSALGNPPFYEVFGQRYFVLPSDENYLERGVASWYGEKFHGARTASGETYDMYAMTAAHKTLPLPSYARVTNLRNGRSIVVRINDRGPFVSNRLIDLSYSAALKLDMVRDGTTLVEVETLNAGAVAGAAARPPAPAAQTLFVQAGAFRDMDNAERLRSRISAQGLGRSFVRRDSVDGKDLYRVRIAVDSVADFDRVVAHLRRLDIHDAHLALN